VIDTIERGFEFGAVADGYSGKGVMGTVQKKV